MSGLALNALLLAVSALPMTAAAQLTYKCGNSYSQAPCLDAVTIDTSDRRTSAQKLQTDLATQRDARTADTMEKARLQQEAKDLAANTPAPKASKPAPKSKKKAGQVQMKANTTRKPTTNKAQNQGKKSPLTAASRQEAPRQP